MNNLLIIYKDIRIMRYIHYQVEKVSSVITNVEKLEWNIYEQLNNYLNNLLNTRRQLSIRRIYYLVDREISKAIKEYRLQEAVTYSDLAVTNDFGESLMYEPIDGVTNVEEKVERNSLQGKIARLASDDFEKYVLAAWSRGERSIDIAKDLAILGNRDVAYFKLKVARFKSRCRKRWTMETFV